MKYISPGEYEWHDGEPKMRSCPECNSSHQHLWMTNKVHNCYDCGRWWVLGRYLNDPYMTQEERDQFIQEHEEEMAGEYKPGYVIFTMGGVEEQ